MQSPTAVATETKLSDAEECSEIESLLVRGNDEPIEVVMRCGSQPGKRMPVFRLRKTAISPVFYKVTLTNLPGICVTPATGVLDNRRPLATLTMLKRTKSLDHANLPGVFAIYLFVATDEIYKKHAVEPFRFWNTITVGHPEVQVIEILMKEKLAHNAALTTSEKNKATTQMSTGWRRKRPQVFILGAIFVIIVFIVILIAFFAS